MPSRFWLSACGVVDVEAYLGTYNAGDAFWSDTTIGRQALGVARRFVVQTGAESRRHSSGPRPPSVFARVRVKHTILTYRFQSNAEEKRF